MNQKDIEFIAWTTSMLVRADNTNCPQKPEMWKE